jgi:hypothetical protein
VAKISVSLSSWGGTGGSSLMAQCFPLRRNVWSGMTEKLFPFGKAVHAKIPLLVERWRKAPWSTAYGLDWQLKY